MLKFSVPGDDERSAILRGWYRDDERRLRPGQELRIGRHKENDIVLLDPSVSRFHATIRWDPSLERPFLFDHGSQNGTIVDGHELRSHAALVRQGTVIEIPPYLITCELVNCGETPAILTTADDLVALFSERRPDLQGRLGVGGCSLREVLQRLEVERRSGTLHLDFEGTDAGKITLCLGKVMACEHGALQGFRALASLVRPRQGAFRFSRDLEPAEQVMDLWFSDWLRARGGTGPRTSSRGKIFQADEADTGDEAR